MSSFDEVADALVERGIRVTYESLKVALRERDRREGGPGRAMSNRDLQAPFDDWKRKRRYRPYLAALDLPDDMERALAEIADRALAVAKRHVGAATAERDETEMPPAPGTTRRLIDLVEGLQVQVAALADDNRALRDQVAALAIPRTERIPDVPMPVAPPSRAKRPGRRKGLAAGMARLFWDRVMQAFVEAIRRNGPMTAAALYESLDEDTRELAAAAFEPIEVSLITEKVEERIKRKAYFRKTSDGLYDVF